MSLLQKCIFLLMIAQPLAFVPCSIMLNASKKENADKKESVQAYEQDGQKDEDVNEECTTTLSKPKKKRALIPYLIIGGIGAAIITIILSILKNEHLLPHQKLSLEDSETVPHPTASTVNSGIYPPKKLSAELISEEARLLSELNNIQFDEISNKAWTNEERATFKELMENKVFAHVFKYDCSYPLAWMSKAKSDALAKCFSQKQLNDLHTMVAKARLEMGTPEKRTTQHIETVPSSYKSLIESVEWKHYKESTPQKQEIFATFHRFDRQEEVDTFQKLLKTTVSTLSSSASVDDLQLLIKGLSHAHTEWAQREKAIERFTQSSFWQTIKDWTIKKTITDPDKYAKLMDALQVANDRRDSVTFADLTSLYALYRLTVEEIEHFKLKILSLVPKKFAQEGLAKARNDFFTALPDNDERINFMKKVLSNEVWKQFHKMIDNHGYAAFDTNDAFATQHVKKVPQEDACFLWSCYEKALTCIINNKSKHLKEINHENTITPPS